MEIILIVAVSQNGVIGNNGDLPWHLPDDMKHFKKTTNGYPVIMGRKNWESIPEKYRPLPNRLNIVLSRNENYEVPFADTADSLEEALDIAIKEGDDKAFIIGGAEIYNLAIEMDIVDTLLITEVFVYDLDGDVKFDLSNELETDKWKEIERTIHSVDEKHKYPFDIVRYEKK